MLCGDPQHGNIYQFLQEKYKVDKDYDLVTMALDDPKHNDNLELKNWLHKDKIMLEVKSKAFKEGMILVERWIVNEYLEIRSTLTFALKLFNQSSFVCDLSPLIKYHVWPLLALLIL